MSDLTQARLRELINYDPDTGIFRWQNHDARRRPKDSVAGKRSGRYSQITIGYRRYQAHRLAFLYMTGKWPPDVVDHINGDGFDNRFANLRLATKSQNQQNRRHRSGNVMYVPKREKWWARIDMAGRRHHVGYFDEKGAARAAIRNLLPRLLPNCPQRDPTRPH
jgi:hypothetical protein